MKKRTIKDLEIEFSWAQFYQNSHKLAIKRYPRRYISSKNDEGIKISLIDIPFSDNILFNRCQQRILEIKEEIFGK